MPYKVRELERMLKAPNTTVQAGRQITALLETEREKAQQAYDEAVGGIWARFTERAEDFSKGYDQRGGSPGKLGASAVISELKKLKADAEILSVEDFERRLAKVDTALDSLTGDVAGMRRDVEALDRTENGPPGFKGEKWEPADWYDAFLDRNPAILARGDRGGYDYENAGAAS